MFLLLSEVLHIDVSTMLPQIGTAVSESPVATGSTATYDDFELIDSLVDDDDDSLVDGDDDSLVDGDDDDSLIDGDDSDFHCNNSDDNINDIIIIIVNV